MKNAIYYSFLFHFRSPILPYSHPPYNESTKIYFKVEDHQEGRIF